MPHTTHRSLSNAYNSTLNTPPEGLPQDAQRTGHFGENFFALMAKKTRSGGLAGDIGMGYAGSTGHAKGGYKLP